MKPHTKPLWHFPFPVNILYVRREVQNVVKDETIRFQVNMVAYPFMQSCLQWESPECAHGCKIFCDATGASQVRAWLAVFTVVLLKIQAIVAAIVIIEMLLFIWGCRPKCTCLPRLDQYLPIWTYSPHRKSKMEADHMQNSAYCKVCPGLYYIYKIFVFSPCLTSLRMWSHGPWVPLNLICLSDSPKL